LIQRAYERLTQRDDKPATQGRIGLLLAIQLLDALDELRVETNLMEHAINIAAMAFADRSSSPLTAIKRNSRGGR
jgi:hypothetical protein